MTRHYRKPPIIEAVCEFKFASSQVWDMLLPGRLSELLRSDFPGTEPVNTVQVVQDQSGQSSVQVQSAVRLVTEDKSEAIQIGVNTLAVHQIGQYRQWDHFKLRIKSALEAYTKVAEVEGFIRVGLRYINRVELAGPPHELNDYFRVVPRVPDPVPQIFQTFLEQVQIPYGGPSDETAPDSWLRLTFGTVVPQTPNTVAFVLDLDMFTPDNAAPTSPENVEMWLETAHSRIEEAFDAAFTEKTHEEVFEEVKS